MANPVMQALVNARLQQVTRDEANLAEQVTEVLGPPPPDIHRPQRFRKWCDEQGLPWRPASPAAIAKWVLQHTKFGNVMEEVRSISAAHTTTGLPDPCGSWQVSEALCRITTVQPPRSWPKAEQAVFLSLPPDLQKYLIPREKERDIAVKRAQNEAADARKETEALRKQLAEIQKGTEANGTTENPPDETRAA
jgi:hypothetical protein